MCTILTLFSVKLFSVKRRGFRHQLQLAVFLFSILCVAVPFVAHGASEASKATKCGTMLAAGKDTVIAKSDPHLRALEEELQSRVRADFQAQYFAGLYMGLAKEGLIDAHSTLEFLKQGLNFYESGRGYLDELAVLMVLNKHSNPRRAFKDFAQGYVDASGNLVSPYSDYEQFSIDAAYEYEVFKGRAKSSKGEVFSLYRWKLMIYRQVLEAIRRVEKKYGLRGGAKA